MEAFVWNDCYMTGEAVVDGEHRELVRIINWVGDLNARQASPAEIKKVLGYLLNYATIHFGHEDRLMVEHGIDVRHLEQHRHIHGDFVQQVQQMQTVSVGDSDTDFLLRFLTHWLAFHILGTDQSMARQLQSIRNGMTPAEAFDHESERVADPATASLLEALNSLYRVIAARNRALVELNLQLESRVKDRTREYQEANQKLATEHRRVKETLITLETTQRQLVESERQRAALDVERKMQLMLSQIVDGDPVPTLVIDANHRVTHWNKACAAITGLPAEVLLGTCDHWKPFYAHERPIMADLIVDGGLEAGFETHYHGKFRRSVLIEGAFEGEDFFPFCGENGRWLYFTAAPLRDADGRVVGAIETLQDVTARHRAEDELRRTHGELEGTVELRTAELKTANAALLEHNGELTRLNAALSEAKEQLIQSEKLASIGQLAAGVAHEINNPIGYVFSNIGTLQNYVGGLFKVLQSYQAAEGHLPAEQRAEIARLRQEADLDFLADDIPALLEESKEGITRVKKIVQDLKDFSRVDTSQEWQWANLHQGLESTINIVANEVKYKADVIREYGDLPDVECLPGQLNQVFMNLLVNAAHAIGPERGRIVVRTGVENDTVWLEFCDNGSGIPEDIRQKIFDPFFTTKAIGKGTGLGLSLSYGIVKNHNGHIELSSEVGQGSTFRIVLPISHDGAAGGVQ